jgi:hypothetical protein
VFIGVHCWRWLSHTTGFSQTWYLSHVVCMCCTLNYMSDKCPEFFDQELPPPTPPPPPGRQFLSQS